MISNDLVIILHNLCKIRDKKKLISEFIDTIGKQLNITDNYFSEEVTKKGRNIQEIKTLRNTYG